MPQTAHHTMSEMIQKAWDDPAFKERLLSHPDDVIREHGFTIPPGLSCRVVEDTPTLHHLVLPARPSRMSDDELDAVAGGGDVQLSPNVVNAFQQINDAGALQFDLPNYVQQNMPLPQYNPYPNWNMGPAPDTYR